MVSAHRRLNLKYLQCYVAQVSSLFLQISGWQAFKLRLTTYPKICCLQVAVSSRSLSCKTICYLLKNSQILIEPLFTYLLHIKWKIQATRNIIQFLQCSTVRLLWWGGRCNLGNWSKASAEDLYSESGWKNKEYLKQLCAKNIHRDEPCFVANIVVGLKSL